MIPPALDIRPDGEDQPLFPSTNTGTALPTCLCGVGCGECDAKFICFLLMSLLLSFSSASEFSREELTTTAFLDGHPELDRDLVASWCGEFIPNADSCGGGFDPTEFLDFTPEFG